MTIKPYTVEPGHKYVEGFYEGNMIMIDILKTKRGWVARFYNHDNKSSDFIGKPTSKLKEKLEEVESKVLLKESYVK